MTETKTNNIMVSVLGGNKGEIAFQCDLDYILDIIKGNFREEDKEALNYNKDTVIKARVAKQAGDLELARQLKSRLIAVTYNATFNKRRIKADVKELSGFVYLDFDKVDLSLKDKLKEFEFVKAVFKSSGGNGLSCLVQVVGLTLDNFTYNVTRIHEMLNFEGLDKACKDITRMTYLTYDSEIYINNDCRPLRALKPPINTIISKKIDNESEGIEIAKNTANKKYGEFRDGVKNNWLLTFLGTALRVGVDKYTAQSYLETLPINRNDLNYKINYVYSNYL